MSNGWLVLAAVASPVASFAGGAVGAWFSRRSDDRLDRWRRREETMRTIRWAAEKAADADASLSEIGFAALEALAGSEMLQAEDRRFLSRVTDAALAEPLAEMLPGVDTRLVDEGRP